MQRYGLALLAPVAFLLVASPARTHAQDGTPRAEMRAPPGTGLIAGQVIDGITSKPIPDAMVDLLPLVAPTSPTSTNGTPRLRVITDPTGRFYFADLPSGRYNLRANKAGYLVSNGSRRRPIGFTNSYPSTIDLGDAEKVLDWTLPLWKFGVIAGTVLDEAGDPAVGVEVRPLRRTFVSGRPRFTLVSSSIVATDDRGMFRIASLPPGDYAIYIPTTMTSFPASMMEDPAGGFLGGNQELMSTIREISILGSPTNQKIGDAVLLTLNRAPRPPAPANGRVATYSMTFHPAAPGAPPSEFLPVRAGEEQIVSLQLRLSPAVTVAGTLSGPAGPLPRTAVRLVSAALAGSAADADLETATGVTDDRGRFTLLGVPTGQYVLRVLTPPRAGNAPTPPSSSDHPVLWASETLTVGDTDITDLAIAARPALTVTGRLQVRRGANQPDARALAGLYVNFDARSGGSSGAIQTDQNGAFAAGVPGGRYSVRVETPEGWRLVAAEVDGRDASDQPIEISKDATLVFTLTDQRTQLSGTVRDARGQPDAFGLVGVFPARRDWWIADYPLTSWRMRATQLSARGDYLFADLPSGEYFVVSIPETIGEQWLNPANLETLSRTAVRVTIADGDARVQDLRAAVR